MSNDRPLPAADFRRRVEAAAAAFLAHHPKAQEAAARVSLAFAAAARAARDPSALYGAAPESVGAAVALSALYDLMPGGPAPLVYLVPQGGQLQWRLTHRGMATLAARAGYSIRTVPVRMADRERVVMDLGEVLSYQPSDVSAVPAGLDDLAGVIVVVTGGGSRVAHWVPGPTIRRRASVSASKGGPWSAWPVAMAQGAAIREVVARGSLLLDLPADTDDTEAPDAPPAIAASPAPRMLPAPVSLDDLPDAPLEPEPVPAVAMREPGED